MNPHLKLRKSPPAKRGRTFFCSENEQDPSWQLLMNGGQFGHPIPFHRFILKEKKNRVLFIC